MIVKNESYNRKLIKEGNRLDGRKLDEYRKIEIKTGVSYNAEGSCEVRIGKTHVIVGIKMDVKTPFPDTPDEGVIMVGAEFDPISSPEFEPGPPRADSIELARVVDRAIRESKCIDLGKLCIEKKEKVWSIMIDIEVLNHDGNLMDAASIGTIMALMDVKMPKYDKKTEKADYKEKKGKLPLRDKPLEITVNKIGDKLVLDLTAEEEHSMDARLTVGMTEKGDLCALQKGGDGYLTIDEIKNAVEMALNKVKEIRKLLKV